MVKICYHEIRHILQDDFKFDSYEYFLGNIENYIRIMNSGDYNFYHDRYSSEIGANMYAISKSKDYLIKKYPEYYEQIRFIIETEESICEFYYLTYDAVLVLDKYIFNYKKYRCDEKKYLKSCIKYTILSVFLNDDGTFKNVSDIIINDKFESLDFRIISVFFSCDAFLEVLNIETITLEEIDIITNSLKYTCTVYKNQKSYIKKCLLNDMLEEDVAINIISYYESRIKQYENILDKLNACIISKSNNFTSCRIYQRRRNKDGESFRV